MITLIGSNQFLADDQTSYIFQLNAGRTNSSAEQCLKCVLIISVSNLSTTNLIKYEL